MNQDCRTESKGTSRALGVAAAIITSAALLFTIIRVLAGAPFADLIIPAAGLLFVVWVIKRRS